MHSRPRTLRSLLGLAVIVIAGLGAFLASRYAFSTDSPAGAQLSPSGTPEVREQPPNPTLAAVMTASASDQNKPRFTGELNGITFVGEGTPFPNGCPNGTLAYAPANQIPSLLKTSELNFTPTFLPSGYSVSKETVVICDQSVVGVAQVYSNGTTGGPTDISIIKEKNGSFKSAIAPHDRLQAVTIAGNSAVVVNPAFKGDISYVFMTNDAGITWTLSSALDVTQLIKVAEGLK